MDDERKVEAVKGILERTKVHELTEQEIKLRQILRGRIL